MGKLTEQSFFKARSPNGEKTHEEMLTIPDHKGNASQNHVKIPLTHVRIATIKNTKNNKWWQGCGEKGTLIYSLWECKLVQPLWKTVLEASSKN
jgi:hypothetical protein